MQRTATAAPSTQAPRSAITAEPAVTCNDDQQLYVIPCDGGYTCLGYDVARDQAKRYEAWLAGDHPDAPRASVADQLVGTPAGYAHHRAVVQQVLERCRAQNTRCLVDLHPKLTGLEGKLVELVEPNGDKRNRIISRSTGPIPIHLECGPHGRDGLGISRTDAFAQVNVLR